MRFQLFPLEVEPAQAESADIQFAYLAEALPHHPGITMQIEQPVMIEQCPVVRKFQMMACEYEIEYLEARVEKLARKGRLRKN